jgi:hypothetical protein
VRANRSVDPTVTVGLSAARGYADGVDGSGNPVDGAPRSRALSLSLAIPIPLSRRDHGDVVQAEAGVTQAMLALRQAELKAETEVRTAQRQWRSAQERLARYRDGVLQDAQKVVDGMRLSYVKGNASLLEWLAAQHSADDAWQAYLQARADAAIASTQLHWPPASGRTYNADNKGRLQRGDTGAAKKPHRSSRAGITEAGQARRCRRPHRRRPLPARRLQYPFAVGRLRIVFRFQLAPGFFLGFLLSFSSSFCRFSYWKFVLAIYYLFSFLLLQITA